MDFNTGLPRKGASVGLARRAILLFGCLLALVLVLASVMLFRIADQLDTEANEQKQFFAEMALKTRQANLQQSIADYAFWGDAYRNLHASVDVDWAYTRRNVGATLYENFGYDGVFVVAPDERTVYSVIQGKLQPMQLQQWVQGDVSGLLEQARTQADDEGTAIALLPVKGQAALVAAAALTTGGDPRVPVVPGKSSVMLFVDVLTPEKLQSLAQDYALSGLRISSGLDTKSASAPGISLVADGDAYLSLQWDAARPGSLLLALLLPVIVAVGLIVAVLGWLAMRYALTAARRLDASYRSLADSEARFQDIAGISSDWFWETDAEFRLTYLSDRFQSVTGHAPSAWLGRPLSELLTFTTESLTNWISSPLLRMAPHTPLPASYRSANDKYCLCNLVVRAIGDTAVNGYRGIARDITAEVENQARIRQLQQYDPLTGLANRGYLKEQLARLLESQHPSGNSIAVLSIGFDRLRQVTERFGSGVGDQMLLGLSQRLESFLRQEDLLARHSSDEFTVVLHDGFGLTEYVEQMCGNLIKCVEQPFWVGQQQIFLSMRIGIALAPREPGTAAELIRTSEVALYQARNQQDVRWCFYTLELERRIDEEKQLEQELRSAIGNQELRLHLQPRYRAGDQQPTGVEALVRWQHPRLGLLGPNLFIPLAEKNGLIAALGTWVLKQACRQVMQLPKPLFVSVNLSPEQFRSSDLLESVQTTLEESGLPAARLELEITESMMLEDAQSALATLQALKALGVRLSMDDFGTGYSSLSYLRQYPFDTLKIDKSFVAQLDTSEKGLAIVLAIVWLGHALEMEVTAEGVENAKQFGLLKEMGCDEVQGYLLSRPLPLEQLRSVLDRESLPLIEV